jgi:hypothetical protein
LSELIINAARALGTLEVRCFHQSRANDNVELSAQYVSAFAVSRKVDGRRLEQLMRLFGQLVALFLFRAVVESSTRGLFTPMTLYHVRGAHQRELHEIFALAVRVCAAIQQQNARSGVGITVASAGRSHAFKRLMISVAPVNSAPVCYPPKERSPLCPRLPLLPARTMRGVLSFADCERRLFRRNRLTSVV